MMAERIIPEDGFGMTHYSSHQNDAFAGTITGAAIDYIEENGIVYDDTPRLIVESTQIGLSAALRGETEELPSREGSSFSYHLSVPRPY